VPDGSAGTIPAVATDVFGEQLRETPVGTVLTAAGFRRLRALLEAKSAVRGTAGPAAARPGLPSTFRANEMWR
jgi:hypothetical protein